MENITSGKDWQEWEIEVYIFEKLESCQYCKSWNIPVFFSTLYLFIVFFGTKYMSKRSRYNLRPYLFLWSASLAVFSIVGSYRTLLIASEIYSRGGLSGMICNSSFHVTVITRVWRILFTWSKFLEYIDTVFIILRKQRLIFLHWYHHFTVALFAWLMMTNVYAGGINFLCMNLLVHSFMYSYYAIRAAGFKTPKFISIAITTMQIAQMLMGCYVMISLSLKFNTGECSTSFIQLLSGTVMYFSYLILFAYFFYTNYIKSQPRKVSSEDHLKKTSPNKAKNESRRITRANGSNTNDSLRKRRN